MTWFILIWASAISIIVVMAIYLIYCHGKKSAQLEIMEKAYRERDRIESAAAKKEAQIVADHDDRIDAVRNSVSTEVESLANTTAELLDQQPDHDNN